MGGMILTQESPNSMLRKLPAVNSILISEPGQIMVEEYGHELVVEALNIVLDKCRQNLLAGLICEPNSASIAQEAANYLSNYFTPRLKRVINATGIILHTNLGRAVLSEKAQSALRVSAASYTNLEYDLATGRRGSRHSLVEHLLVRLTGAESAMVVNNNAAAVLLVMHTLAAGREAIVSRGELVEIGGSFRIPEVLRLGEVKLMEVGTTNRTHLADYQNAIGANTALLLKVHTSNYRIVGFSKTVDRRALKELAMSYNLPLVEDLGSGSLLDLTNLGLQEETPVAKVIAQGADVVTFSGDKLLGGPQAGIIVGKKVFLDAMKGNHLTRALRPDKFTLAALEATLREYLQPREVMKEIPAYQMLSRSLEELDDVAQRMAKDLAVIAGIDSCEVVETRGEMGAGSLPGQDLISKGVALKITGLPLQQMEVALRNLLVPIVGYIEDERLILDARTLLPGDEELIIDGFNTIFKGVKK